MKSPEEQSTLASLKILCGMHGNQRYQVIALVQHILCLFSVIVPYQGPEDDADYDNAQYN
jgi:hypothetical protein